MASFQHVIRNVLDHADNQVRQVMQFSMGFWDWMFGEKLQIKLASGQTRTVTKRWWEEMQRQGKVQPLRETIRVHSIGKPPEFNGDRIQFDEWLMADGKTYVVENWEVGVQIPCAEVEKWRDPQTGDVYIFNELVDDKWHFRCCTREVFAKFKAVEDGQF